MSKRKLIDSIRELNLTAQPTFLAEFDEAALQAYLDRLRDALSHRLDIHSWARKAQPLRKVS